MNIYALQTARKGSESVTDKNRYTIKGRPLFIHNVWAAKACKEIKEVYVSTDDEIIQRSPYNKDYEIIDRPKHLCGSAASHHEVILQGLLEIESRENTFCDILVVLLGNSMGATHEELTEAIEILKADETLDSVQSVGEFNMFNPFRAHYLQSDGTLETVFSQEQIAEKQKLANPNDKGVGGDMYFFNGSFWVCRRSAIVARDGNTPFPWLGKRIYAYVQKQGIQELDAPWQTLCFDHYEKMLEMK